MLCFGGVVWTLSVRLFCGLYLFQMLVVIFYKLCPLGVAPGGVDYILSVR